MKCAKCGRTIDEKEDWHKFEKPGGSGLLFRTLIKDWEKMYGKGEVFMCPECYEKNKNKPLCGLLNFG